MNDPRDRCHRDDGSEGPKGSDKWSPEQWQEYNEWAKGLPPKSFLTSGGPGQPPRWEQDPREVAEWQEYLKTNTPKPKPEFVE